MLHLDVNMAVSGAMRVSGIGFEGHKFLAIPGERFHLGEAEGVELRINGINRRSISVSAGR